MFQIHLKHVLLFLFKKSIFNVQVIVEMKKNNEIFYDIFNYLIIAIKYFRNFETACVFSCLLLLIEYIF